VSLKHLPISVVSPLQATRPMWTLIGAMLIFGERLNGWQWTGVLLALGTVLLFSLYSRKVSADTPKNASIHHSINRAPADFNLGEEEELRQLYKLRSNAVIDLQFRRSERLNPSLNNRSILFFETLRKRSFRNTCLYNLLIISHLQNTTLGTQILC
jgi:hypothetical protein